VKCDPRHHMVNFKTLMLICSYMYVESECSEALCRWLRDHPQCTDQSRCLV